VSALNAARLAMPPVDRLISMNALNVILDMAMPEQSSGNVPSGGYALTGLFINFCRLTDKALREYESARRALSEYVSGNGLDPVPYLTAIDHMENCIDAAHRAVLNADALRSLRVGRASLAVTEAQRARLKRVRDAIEHSDDRLLNRSRSALRPAFQQGQPFSLDMDNTRVVIGSHVLTYNQLVSVLTKCYRMIEQIRGAPTALAVGGFYRADEEAAISAYYRDRLRRPITHA
jgi:hypothetical protein